MNDFLMMHHCLNLNWITFDFYTINIVAKGPGSTPYTPIPPPPPPRNWVKKSWAETYTNDWANKACLRLDI